MLETVLQQRCRCVSFSYSSSSSPTSLSLLFLIASSLASLVSFVSCSAYLWLSLFVVKMRVFFSVYYFSLVLFVELLPSFFLFRTLNIIHLTFQEIIIETVCRFFFVLSFFKHALCNFYTKSFQIMYDFSLKIMIDHWFCPFFILNAIKKRQIGNYFT